MNKKLRHMALIGIFTSAFSLCELYSNFLNLSESVSAQETQTYSSDENNTSTYLDNITINGGEIGFSYIDREYDLRLDNPSGKLLIKVYPQSSDTTIKVSNTILNASNSIILRMSEFGTYEIPIVINNKITNKSRQYTLNIYRGVSVPPKHHDYDVVKGWTQDKDSKAWSYAYEDGQEVKNAWLYDQNLKNYYHFDEFGYMQKSWVSDSEGKYFLNGSGALYKGWIDLNSKWYYLDEITGIAKQSEWYLSKDGSYYYFDNKCVMQTDWIKDYDKWYYLDQNGKMIRGWIKYKGNDYYLGDSGAMESNTWKNIDNVWYYFNGDGTMAKYWIKYNNKWYYLNDNGSMKKGWFCYKNNWYYLDDSGEMLSGKWHQDGDDWYYINYSGTMRTGWLSKDGNLYYLNSNGKMEKNGVYFEGVYLSCNADGSVNII